MKACSRRTFDQPINIPAVQASVMKRAYEAGLRSFPAPAANGKRVAVIGAGPAGLGAATVLAQRGYKVTVFEQRERLGGMMNLIPDFRLDKKVVRRDIEFLKGLGALEFAAGQGGEPARRSCWPTIEAVIVCAGLEEPIRLSIPGEEYALSWQEYLENQKQDQRRGQEGGRPGRRRGGGGLRYDGQAARRALGRAGLSPQAGEHAADGL